MQDKGKILEEHFKVVLTDICYIMVISDNRVMVSLLGIHEIINIESYMLLRSPISVDNIKRTRLFWYDPNSTAIG